MDKLNFEIIGKMERGEITPTDEQVKQVMRPFILAVATRHKNQGLSKVELISAGEKGMLEAWHNYGAHRDVRLVAYSVWYIRTAMEAMIAKAHTFLPVKQPFYVKVVKDAKTLISVGDIHHICRVFDTAVPMLECDLTLLIKDRLKADSVETMTADQFRELHSKIAESNGNIEFV